MKKIVKTLPLLFFAFLLTSCKKEVPSDKLSFLGQWLSADGATQITIDPDGHGFYTYHSQGMGYFKDKRINGRVQFTSTGFEIKTIIAKKKFSVNQNPTKLPPSNSYISAAYVARFNDQNYYKY